MSARDFRPLFIALLFGVSVSAYSQTNLPEGADRAEQMRRMPRAWSRAPIRLQRARLGDSGSHDEQRRRASAR